MGLVLHRVRLLPGPHAAGRTAGAGQRGGAKAAPAVDAHAHREDWRECRGPECDRPALVHLVYGHTTQVRGRRAREVRIAGAAARHAAGIARMGALLSRYLLRALWIGGRSSRLEWW